MWKNAASRKNKVKDSNQIIITKNQDQLTPIVTKIHANFQTDQINCSQGKFYDDSNGFDADLMGGEKRWKRGKFACVGFSGGPFSDAHTAYNLIWMS